MRKVSWRGRKVVTCSFYGGEERGNLDESTSIICSICVLRLCNTPGDVLKRAYDRLIEKGNFKRAELISSFIGRGSNVRRKAITEKARTHIRNSGGRLINRIRYERASRFTSKHSS